MFLGKLYRYSKAGFIACLFCLLFFLYINYKWGVVATPFNLYGMYSGKYMLSDTLEIYTLRSTASLRVSDLSVVSRDFIQAYPARFQNAAMHNREVFTTMKRLPGIGQNDSLKFINQVSAHEFHNWYSHKFNKIIGTTSGEREVYRHRLTWQNGTLSDIRSPEKIMTLAP